MSRALDFDTPGELTVSFGLLTVANMDFAKEQRFGEARLRVQQLLV